MSGPSCMRNRNLSDAAFLDIELGSSDLLAKTRNFANFFEIFDRSRLIAIDREASRVISTIFLASKVSTQDFQISSRRWQKDPSVSFRDWRCVYAAVRPLRINGRRCSIGQWSTGTVGQRICAGHVNIFRLEQHTFSFK
jgi:hypothetical protein